MGLLDTILNGAGLANQALAAKSQGQRDNAIQQSQLLRAIALQQAQVEHLGAETGNLNTKTAQGQYDLAHPVARTIDEKAKEAGAVADAGVQPGIRKAVGIAAGTAPIEEDKAVNIATRTAPIKVKEAVDTAAGVEPIHTRGAIATAAGVAPIHTQEAINTAAGTAPTKIAVERAANDFKPLSADENTATLQLPRMAGALQRIQQLPTQDVRAAATAHGGFWKNYLNTPAGRQFNQAATQAALAGAVASEGPRGAQPDRVEYFKRTYVPQAGDDDATAEQKLAAFRELTRGVAVKAGRGMNRLAPQHKALVSSVLNDDAPAAGAAHSVVSKYGITPSVP